MFFVALSANVWKKCFVFYSMCDFVYYLQFDRMREALVSLDLMGFLAEQINWMGEKVFHRHYFSVAGESCFCRPTAVQLCKIIIGKCERGGGFVWRDMMN